jgi:dephospho-CoA kinase
MLIGLTGQIGAGKTSAARILARLGAAVVDADQIGRKVVDQSSVLRRKLAKVFGNSVIDGKGRVYRKKLAELAFAGGNATETLNALVHPYLLKELRRRVRRASRTHAVAVIDAALLLYWGLDKEVDFVLVIHASRATRLKRLEARGISRKDALARERAQLSFREFQQRADRVMLNNGTIDDLKRKIQTLYRQIAIQTD